MYTVKRIARRIRLWKRVFGGGKKNKNMEDLRREKDEILRRYRCESCESFLSDSRRFCVGKTRKNDIYSESADGDVYRVFMYFGFIRGWRKSSRENDIQIFPTLLKRRFREVREIFRKIWKRLKMCTEFEDNIVLRRWICIKKKIKSISDFLLKYLDCGG